MTSERKDRSSGRSGSPDLPDDGAADSPTDLTKTSWVKVLRGAGREFSNDNLSDTAAALTYYSIQSIFPAALVLVSCLGFLSRDTTRMLIANLGVVIPGSAQATIVSTITTLQQSSRHGAGLAFLVGLGLAIWSASGYVAAFMRAANTVYDVPEGRPIWKTMPTRLFTTLVLLILMIAAAAIVVFTGPLARQAGDLLGLGSAAVTAWGLIKWPVLMVLMMVMVGILYWAAPNAKQGFKWVSPGGILGVLIWILASALFALYVAEFSNYNKTYGTFAGVIVFLVWMWISNLAILLGAEFNAELERSRAEQAGLPRGAEPYVELRDTRKLTDEQKTDVEGARQHLATTPSASAGTDSPAG